MAYNFIDLFAGCGGLSEGFYRQGYNALAHVEIDNIACKTLRTRMSYYGYESPDEAVVEADITRDNIVKLIDNAIGNKKVDIIIGGPPCQAYSTLGRAKDENGMKNDPRNFLFESYVKILNYYKPACFVFENVTGILTAEVKGKKIIKEIVAALSEYYDVELKVLNSANYGVPQIRKRVIIIGVRKDIGIGASAVFEKIKMSHYDPEMPESEKNGLKKYVTVKDAIFELPKIHPGEGRREIPFTYSFNNDFLKKIGSKKLNVLRDHVARNHNSVDVERYTVMAKNHWTFQEMLDNCPELRHEKARVFNNSYVVQWWDLPSKTIIAHLYKDGNQFIHPDSEQGRTFTVRETARIQSFPDDFVFEGSRTDQFKQIGNAVPPLFAEAIAKGITDFLNEVKNDF